MAAGKDKKPHIGIFGRRNFGKSSLINKLSGQETAIVSNTAGTTTDPVKKSMEINGIGAVVLVDTAGIDDTGDLGRQRINKSFKIISQIDLAILVIAHNTFHDFEEDLISHFHKKNVPFIVVHNKSDEETINAKLQETIETKHKCQVLDFSCLKNENTQNIVHLLRKTIPKTAYQNNSLIGDLIKAGDTVLLVTPIDDEAPEGRLILPQVQLIRDVLDNDAAAFVVKERELDAYLRKMQPQPALVITDSQVFLKVDASVPADIPMTSFSIVLARQKGYFEQYIEGTKKLGNLNDGDKILLLESCTHHVSCDDIGRVKIPRWLSQFSGKQLNYTVVSGLDDIPGEISDYAIVIQCGGCVITNKQVQNRIKPAIDAGVAVSNYGMCIAYVQGIFSRATKPFMLQKEPTIDYL
ncbi:MAG: [FeFe] hydrogenase H-cluster maturation GTPase HydF [Bacteroidetes bacterium 4572_77]|nr:MAG: [FeFe] hydrogenase H-cluster maturation GTPase HydF [Bacteroidetes bacterium 4572_77]